MAGPGLAVISLGLASALAWGAGDFGGGWTTRRAPVLGVALTIDALGVVVMVALGLATGEPLPGLAMALMAALAGVFAVIGMLGLYTGLAVGRMGVVAPVTGLIAAALPVGVGFAIDGLPGTPVAIGIGLALVAVVLVSASTDSSGRPAGFWYGVLGGVGIGLFNVVVGAFPEDGIAWPLVLIRGSAFVGTLAIVLVARRPWRVARPVLPAVVATGFLDLLGNGFYILATQEGRLDVAATLSSLYPVTTIILAVVLLHERVTRSHLAGIMMAAIAIALIAGGSAA